jgi:hypothetical protein
MQDLMPVFKEMLDQGKTVRFSPRGVSMLPMLRQGKDTVTLSPVSGKLKKHDIPLYRRDDGAYVLHRIIAVGKTYTCIGDNQYIYEPGVRDDQIIGVVTSFTRGKREYTVTDWRYRLYLTLWCRTVTIRKHMLDGVHKVLGTRRR